MLDKQGQMRIVEAFLAILLLFSALALASLISPTSNFEGTADLATLGMQTLVSMDKDGQLGRLIDADNWTALGDALEMLLPVGVSYNLTVYDEHLQPLNAAPISNTLLSERDVVSVQYPCVSPTSQSNCYLLRLQLATAR